MIIVTGGTGHIGNILVKKLLEKGHEVRIIVPPFEDLTPVKELDVQIEFADVRDEEKITSCFKNGSAVFHLASRISIFKRDKKVYDINVKGTENVIKACIKNGIKDLIYVSSVHALKEEPAGIIIKESKDFNPNNVIGDYAKSKAIATNLVFKSQDYGLEPVIVHPSGVIGPYDYKISFINKVIIDYINNKQKFSIKGAYNFVDVRDAAQGIISAWEKGKRGENYILSGETITIEQLFSYLEEFTGIKKPKYTININTALFFSYFADIYYSISKEKPTFTSYSIYTLRTNCNFSCEKAKKELGYFIRPIKQTVFDTVIWLKEYYGK
ncbi:NAD-dependent epimerase/dehydratase family protein [Thermovenabulum sp.]|uniref:NAD-dependent epimerase/dehydratase family protein n=1 Tax=Thermovenabulum sp. TaxID=3100335 RepID=UPI003C7DDC01